MINFLVTTSDDVSISLDLVNTVYDNELTNRCKSPDEWDKAIDELLKAIEVMRGQGHALLDNINYHKKKPVRYRYFGHRAEHLGKFCEYHKGNIITIYPDKISFFGTEDDIKEDDGTLSEHFWEMIKEQHLDFLRMRAELLRIFNRR